MRRLLTTAAALLSAFSVFSDDSNTKSFQSQLAEINKKRSEGFMKDGRFDAKTFTARSEEANKLLLELAANAEKSDRSKLSSVECTAVAQAYLTVQNAGKCIEWAEVAVKREPSNIPAKVVMIRGLISGTQFPRARQLLDDLAKLAPSTSSPLRLSLSLAFERSKDLPAAWEQMKKYLAVQGQLVLRSPTQVLGYVRMLPRAVVLAENAKQIADAETEFGRLMAMFAEKKTDSPTYADLYAELRLQKCRLSAAAGNTLASGKVLQELRTELLAEMETGLRPTAVGQYIRALEVLASPQNAKADAASRAELIDQIRTTATAKAKQGEFVLAAVAGLQQAAQSWVRSDLKSGKAALDAGDEILRKKRAELSEEQFKNAVESMRPVRSSIAAKLKHEELLGVKAPAVDCEFWLNTNESSAPDLSGRVVLLDFWAVWCGPCIKTFPHLREWREKFGDRGLTVLGLTKHYGYGWDAKTNRATRGEAKTDAAERQACVEFLAHHQLKHAVGYSAKTSKTWADFGVTGIPQVVLIDRSGVVRMIRVGATEENTQALEAMIETLVAEPAPNKAR